MSYQQRRPRKPLMLPCSCCAFTHRHHSLAICSRGIPSVHSLLEAASACGIEVPAQATRKRSNTIRPCPNQIFGSRPPHLQQNLFSISYHVAEPYELNQSFTCTCHNIGYPESSTARYREPSCAVTMSEVKNQSPCIHHLACRNQNLSTSCPFPKSIIILLGQTALSKTRRPQK